MPPHTKATLCRSLRAGSGERSSPLSSPSSSGGSRFSRSSSESSSDDAIMMNEGRMLLRNWLIKVADENDVPSMKWMDADRTLLKVPWTHASRHGFDSNKDSCLFRMWAEHSGRYKPGIDHEDPKRWKANFRCAMNSLPDVCEEKSLSQKKGACAYKVYRFKKEQPRKSVMRFQAAKRVCTKAIRKEKTQKKAETMRILRQHIETENQRKQQSMKTQIQSSGLKSAPLRIVTKPERPYALFTSLQHETKQVRQPLTVQLPSSSLHSNGTVPKLTIVKPSPSLKNPPSPTMGSMAPALAQDGEDHAYASSSSTAIISPTSSIPTFVEDDIEEEPLYESVLFEEITEDQLSSSLSSEQSEAIGKLSTEYLVDEDDQGYSSQNSLNESDFYNPQASSDDMLSSASSCSSDSNRTLTQLNRSISEEEVMEVEYPALNGCSYYADPYEEHQEVNVDERMIREYGPDEI